MVEDDHRGVDCLFSLSLVWNLLFVGGIVLMEESGGCFSLKEDFSEGDFGGGRRRRGG